MMNFKDYANYYNLLYKDKDYQTEVDYIDKIIKTNSKTKELYHILDLGCGTGRHDILLAEKDYQVLGIDLSEQMIEIANSNKNDNCSFDVNDIRTFQINKKFDTVLSLFHVASYQTTNDDIEKYLQTAYKHLNKNGLFIFDFWYGPAVLTDKPVVRVKRVENDTLKITRIAEPEIIENQNLVNVHFDIIIEQQKNLKLTRLNEIHSMRYWFLPELKYFAEKNGFQVLKSLKWMGNENLDINSWYGLFILKK